MTVLAVAAAAFGVVMGVSPVLQIRRMWQLRSSRDVSIGFFAVVVAGQLTWVAYGLALPNLAVVLANGAGLLINAMAVVVATSLRRVRVQP